MKAKRTLIRIGAMARKETQHIVRDPRNLYMVVGFPVVLLVIFGFGVSFDLDHVRIAVKDPAPSALSRQFVEGLVASGDFDTVAPPDDPSDADRLFRRREALAVVVLPEDLSASVARGGRVPVQVLMDGSDGTAAGIVLGSLASGLRSESVRISGSGGEGMPLKPMVRPLFNPGMRSAWFLVPGLIAYILGIVAVLLTALTVAREWERGNMEQLFATPIGRLEVVLGKLAPYLAIGFLQALLILTVGCVVFDVPIRGSLGLLGLGTAQFLLCTLSQGLLISVLTRNQQLATQFGAMTSLIPGVLLSGFMFSVENMPAILQGIASLFPTRYYVEILRGVMLRDAGFVALWPQFAALAAIAVVLLCLSTLKFQRRLG